MAPRSLALNQTTYWVLAGGAVALTAAAAVAVYHKISHQRRHLQPCLGGRSSSAEQQHDEGPSIVEVSSAPDSILTPENDLDLIASFQKQLESSEECSAPLIVSANDKVPTKAIDEESRSRANALAATAEATPSEQGTCIGQIDLPPAKEGTASKPIEAPPAVEQRSGTSTVDLSASDSVLPTAREVSDKASKIPTPAPENPPKPLSTLIDGIESPPIEVSNFEERTGDATNRENSGATSSFEPLSEPEPAKSTTSSTIDVIASSSSAEPSTNNVVAADNPPTASVSESESTTRELPSPLIPTPPRPSYFASSPKIGSGENVPSSRHSYRGTERPSVPGRSFSVSPRGSSLLLDPDVDDEDPATPSSSYRGFLGRDGSLPKAPLDPLALPSINHPTDEAISTATTTTAQPLVDAKPTLSEVFAVTETLRASKELVCDADVLLHSQQTSGETEVGSPVTKDAYEEAVVSTNDIPADYTVDAPVVSHEALSSTMADSFTAPEHPMDISTLPQGEAESVVIPTSSSNISLTLQSPSISVAFLGNSILYYNDCPRLVQTMLQSRYKKVIQNSCLRGGASLTSLWQLGNGMQQKFATPPALKGSTETGAGGYYDIGAPTVTSLLKERRWDFVVVNDHTQGPTRPATRQASKSVLEQYAEIISSDTSIIFVQTAAYRKRGIKRSDDLGDFESFSDLLLIGYREYVQYVKTLTNLKACKIAPVGEAFRWLYRRSRDLWYDLYQPDDFHFSPSGTWLEACVIYCTIVQEVPPTYNADWFVSSRVMQPQGEPPLPLPTAEIAAELRRVACIVTGLDGSSGDRGLRWSIQ